MKTLKTLTLTLAALSGALAQADAPSTHGMLVFGKERTYASHLPMFHQPHDYQAIFEIEFGDGDAAGNYQAALHNGRNAYFTIEPERMDLTKVLDGTITQFNAKLYSGHFERGGQLLGSTRVSIKDIILGAKLDGDQAPQSDEYLIFGSEDEAFAAHIIRQRPNFDAILAVSLPANFALEAFSLPIQAWDLASDGIGYRLPQLGEPLIHPRAGAFGVESILYLEEAELH